MQKKYGLKIGEDVVYIASVDFDDSTNLPLDENEKQKYTIYSTVDSVIDITNLETIPAVGSTWNGSLFSEHNPELLNQPLSDNDMPGIKNHSDYNRFAFLQNNILLGLVYYKKGEERHEALIAALSSNPQVVEIE